jgi:hypothetical protein
MRLADQVANAENPNSLDALEGQSSMDGLHSG